MGLRVELVVIILHSHFQHVRGSHAIVHRRILQPWGNYKTGKCEDRKILPIKHGGSSSWSVTLRDQQPALLASGVRYRDVCKQLYSACMIHHSVGSSKSIHGTTQSCLLAADDKNTIGALARRASATVVGRASNMSNQTVQLSISSCRVCLTFMPCNQCIRDSHPYGLVCTSRELFFMYAANWIRNTSLNTS